MGSTVTSPRVAGALLVERGLVSPAQLAEALEHQRANGGDLDELIARLFGLSRSEIASVLADHDSARRIDIGALLYANGAVDADRLGEARIRSLETGQPLGPILVEMGAITRLDLASALADQWSDSPAEILPSPGERAAFAAADRGSFGDVDDLRDAMAALEASVRAAQEPGGGEAAIEDVLRREAELAARVSALEHAIVQPVEADPELLGEINEIAQSLVALQASLTDVATAEDVARLEAAAAEVSGLSGQVGDLTARLETVAPVIALDAVAEEVAELRATLERQSGTGDELETIRAALAELASRPVGDPELATRVADLARNVEALRMLADATSGAEGLQEALAELAARVEVATGAIDAVAELTSRVDELAVLRSRVEELASGSARIDDLGGMVEGLREELSALAAEPRGDNELAGRIDALAESVDHLRSDLTAVAEEPRRDESLAGRLDELASTIADVRSELTGLREQPPRDDELAARVDAFVPEVDAAIAALRKELEAALETTTAIAPLEAAVIETAARVASLEETREELVALRATVASLDERPLPDPALADRVTELANRVESLALDALGPAAEAALGEVTGRLDGVVAGHAELEGKIGEVADRLAGLRAELAARAAPDEVIGRLDVFAEELETLAARLDSTAPAAGLAALVLAVEELQSLVATRDDRLSELERQLVETAARADAARQASDAEVATLRARIDAIAGETESQLGTILERLAAPTSVGSAEGADPALREEVTALGHALESVRASFAAGIEKLEQTWEAERTSLRELASTAPRAEAQAPPSAAGSATPSAPELVAFERELERMRDRITEQERSLVEHFSRREKALIERLGGGTDVGQKLTELSRGLEDVRKRVAAVSAGTGAGGPSGEELAAMKESLFGRIEKLASSIDWRFQRLEGGPGTAASAADLQAKVNELARTVEQLAQAAGAAVTAEPAPAKDEIYLALVPSPTGHQLVELTGVVPAAGERIPDGSGGELVVMAVGVSPLPGDERACVFVEAVETPTPA